MSSLDDLFSKYDKRIEKKEPLSEKSNILIVDDEKNIQNSMQLFFKDKYNVFIADSGEKALELINKEQFSYDTIIDLKTGEYLETPRNITESNFGCIVMDAFLSKNGMDGFQTTKNIKQTFPNLPIVMLTGYHRDHRVQEVYEFGIDRYFEKPLSGENKIEMFKNWIDKNCELYRSMINLNILRNKEAHLKLENEDYRKNLEKKVEEKTEELKEVYSRLLHADKMASLGTVAAGVAHEINNPASAMKTGISEEELILDDLILNSGKYYSLLSETPELEPIVKDIYSSNGGLEIDRNKIRRKTKEIKSSLNEQGIDITQTYAKYLAYLDLDNKNLNILLKDEDNLEENLSYLKKVYDLKSYRNGNKNCVSRILTITSSFKRYSHINQTPEKNINIIESIEDALTIHTNDLKYGIDVKKEYDEIPSIDCYPQELGQVWTNLINNSIHAMDGKGVLDIKVKNLDDYLKVSFTDSGSGIEKEHLSRIFDPFFTLKKQSEGTGLGLNIVYNIIYKKHNGRIDVTSQPGRTQFDIYLPVTSTDSQS